MVRRRSRTSRQSSTRIHLLDVGAEEYGDAILCQFGPTSVLIDGAHPGNQVGSASHPSIPDQLASLLGQEPPFRVDLLVVSHAHLDHVGCLPFLVDSDLLRPDWALVADPKLSWGRATDEAPDFASSDVRVAHLVAALREEPRTSGSDDAAVSQFLLDAVTLEQRYNRMLETLVDRGTTLIRHGRDDAADLHSAFEHVGLNVLGPSQEQLVICAEAIARATRDLVDALSDSPDRDTLRAEVDSYRAALEGDLDLVAGADIADASSRPGPAINLQSIVMRFEHGPARALFTGDMQFAQPEVADPRIAATLTRLRAAVSEDAPYGLVKISHHGSGNAFSAEVLGELRGTGRFGICAGERSTSHPARDVLQLLASSGEGMTWARTDRNGLSTFSWEPEGVQLAVSRGRANDPQPNSDIPAALPELAPPAPPNIESKSMIAERSDEVTVRLPSGTTRVSVSLDLGTSRVEDVSPEVTPPVLRVGGGRDLPPLLFVSSRQGLATNVGEVEADQVLRSIRDRGLPLLDSLPRSSVDAPGAIALVRRELEANQDVEGVVLLGGYDVVPSLRIDSLPPALRQRVGDTDDPDDFIVWSDDQYGDRDGDLMPEVPVSRIPDGKSPELLRAALEATALPPATRRRGVRNVARPFAEQVFADLPGSEPLLISAPATFDQAPPPTLDGDYVYLMLHGDFADGSRFWGEDTPGNREAVNVANIPRPGGRVVLAGCCWGALTVEQPALRMMPGAVPAQKVPEASIAMTFLRHGSLAFVGCTGAHYSPPEPPYDYFGGPMHRAFWQRLIQGSLPATALFQAKIDYLAGWPHGRTTAEQQAIEYKILRQFTCLGLGW